MNQTGDSVEFQLPAIIKTASIITLILAALFYAVDGIKSTLGVASGGLISIFNFLWLRSILFRALHPEAAAPVRFALFRSLSKFLLTAATILALLVSKVVSITGLLVGLSTIVIAIISVLLTKAARSEGDTP